MRSLIGAVVRSHSRGCTSNAVGRLLYAAIVGSGMLLASCPYARAVDPGSAVGEAVYDMDLRSPEAVMNVLPGVPLRLVVHSRLPFATYAVDIEVRSRIPTKLPRLLTGKEAPAEETPRGMPRRDENRDCKSDVYIQLDKGKAAVFLATTEDSLESWITQWRVRAMDTAQAKRACDASLGEVLDSIAAWTRGMLALTSDTLAGIPIPGENETIIVTLRRQSGGEIRTWRITFTTGEPSEFEILYGFSFITNGFSKSEHFVSVPDTGGAFSIRRAEVRNGSYFGFSPSVMAAWFPGRQAQRPVQIGPMAGLGAENGGVAVFTGIYAAVRRNLGIGLGVAGHRIHRLREQYRNGDTLKVTEFLDFDQLHEPEYAFDPFVTVLFRFESSPF